MLNYGGRVICLTIHIGSLEKEDFPQMLKTIHVNSLDKFEFPKPFRRIYVLQTLAFGTSHE